MTNTIDQILNVLIPIGAILFFGFIMFRAFGPQIKGLIGWIKDKFEDDSPRTQRVDPMIGGTINYGR